MGGRPLLLLRHIIRLLQPANEGDGRLLVYRGQSRFTDKVAGRMSGAHLQEFLTGPFARFSRPDMAGLMYYKAGKDIA